jgi:hypothetical protein
MSSFCSALPTEQGEGRGLVHVDYYRYLAEKRISTVVTITSKQVKGSR